MKKYGSISNAATGEACIPFTKIEEGQRYPHEDEDWNRLCCRAVATIRERLEAGERLLSIDVIQADEDFNRDEPLLKMRLVFV